MRRWVEPATSLGAEFQSTLTNYCPVDIVGATHGAGVRLHHGRPARPRHGRTDAEFHTMTGRIMQRSAAIRLPCSYRGTKIAQLSPHDVPPLTLRLRENMGERIRDTCRSPISKLVW